MKIATFLRRRPEGSEGVGIDSGIIRQIEALAPGLEVAASETEDGSDLIEKGFNADVIIAAGVGGGFQCTEYCKYATNLKWIHNAFSGCEAILSNEYLKTRNDILLTNSRGIQGKPMADHVMAAILYFARGYDRMAINQSKKVWERVMGSESCGKTLGIIGMGQIGRRLAERAKAFEMTVLGVKRTPEDIPNVDEVLTNDKMDEAICRSDYLVLLTPASPETYHLMNTEKFALMKKTAYFINVGRGQCVDNDALIAALRQGQIAGAMIDAYDPEPMPQDCPLWEMDNVLVSPHVAADSPLYMGRMIELFGKNLERFMKGEDLLTAVAWE